MTDLVELTIPVTADLVVLARFTAATVASRADFDVEEIEDLRLAVDELCLSVVQDGVAGELNLQFMHDGEEIEVSCRHKGIRPPPSAADEHLDGMSGRILDALVDTHGLRIEDGQRHAWLRKRRVRQPG